MHCNVVFLWFCLFGGELERNVCMHLEKNKLPKDTWLFSLCLNLQLRRHHLPRHKKY